MNVLRSALSCLALAAVAVFFFQAAELARVLRSEIPAAIEGTRSDLDTKVDATAAMLKEQLEQTRTDALAEIDKQLVPELDALNNNAAAVGASIAGSVDQHIGNVEDHLNPVFDNAAATLADTDKTVRDLHPQALGLVAAAKVTAGETAQTMQTVRDATPELVSQAQAIGAEGRAIAEDSHKIADDSSRYVAWFTKPRSKKSEAMRILMLVGIGAIHII